MPREPKAKESQPRDVLAEAPRRPNVRLAHTPEGSPERAIYEPDYGTWYPALAHVRALGVEYRLPVGDDGIPDTAAQQAGWYDEYAHRWLGVSPHYRRMTEKGD